jgi:hypothetical protein
MRPLTTLLPLFPLALATPALIPREPPIEPPTFTPNPITGVWTPTSPFGTLLYNITNSTSSAHFTIHNAPNVATANLSLTILEAAYSCFVTTLGWRSPGLALGTPHNATVPTPWMKLNIYTDPDLRRSRGASGMATPDRPSGYGYVSIVPGYLTDKPEFEDAVVHVLVHEFAHTVMMAELNWNATVMAWTGWAEPLANWFRDLYKSGEVCGAARERYGRAKIKADIPSLASALGESWRVLVDSQNYYYSWPFLTYLGYNPDGIAGLGLEGVRGLVSGARRDDAGETALHVLGRMLDQAGARLSAGEVVAMYWARMAFLDIGHPEGRAQFVETRGEIHWGKYVLADGKWTVAKRMAPLYMGSNITPLELTGNDGVVGIEVTLVGENKVPVEAVRVTVAVRNVVKGDVRYVRFETLKGEVVIREDEEAMLVVVNAPDAPASYLTHEPYTTLDSVGVLYEVVLKGAKFGGH